MKTREPLQGLIMAANHEVIHLALIFAQVFCMYWYVDFACPFERNLETSYFLIAHTWCFVCKMLSYGLERFDHYEWANICKMSYIPYYIACIFEAHYYELQSNVLHTETCEDNKINVLY